MEAERELNASGRRAAQVAVILDALKGGPKTNAELLALAARFGGRLHDLRRMGYRIRTTPLGGGKYLYTLTSLSSNAGAATAAPACSVPCPGS